MACAQSGEPTRSAAASCASQCPYPTLRDTKLGIAHNRGLKSTVIATPPS